MSNWPNARKPKTTKGILKEQRLVQELKLLYRKYKAMNASGRMVYGERALLAIEENKLHIF
jgi:hypothetical protein